MKTHKGSKYYFALALLGLVGTGWIVLCGAALLTAVGCTSWAPEVLRSEGLHAAAAALKDPRGDVARQAQITACRLASFAALQAGRAAQRALTEDSPEYKGLAAAADAAIVAQDKACKAADIKPAKLPPPPPPAVATVPDGGAADGPPPPRDGGAPALAPAPGAAPAAPAPPAPPAAPVPPRAPAAPAVPAMPAAPAVLAAPPVPAAPGGGA